MNENLLAERYLKNINKNVQLNFTLSYRPLQMQHTRHVNHPYTQTTSDRTPMSSLHTCIHTNPVRPNRRPFLLPPHQCLRHTQQPPFLSTKPSLSSHNLTTSSVSRQVLVHTSQFINRDDRLTSTVHILDLARSFASFFCSSQCMQ